MFAPWFMQICRPLLVDVNHSVEKDSSNYRMQTERRPQCSIHLDTTQRREDRDSPLVTFFCQCSNPDVRGSDLLLVFASDLEDPRWQRRRRRRRQRRRWRTTMTIERRERTSLEWNFARISTSDRTLSERRNTRAYASSFNNERQRSFLTWHLDVTRIIILIKKYRTRNKVIRIKRYHGRTVEKGSLLASAGRLCKRRSTHYKARVRRTNVTTNAWVAKPVVHIPGAGSGNERKHVPTM